MLTERVLELLNVQGDKNNLNKVKNTANQLVGEDQED